MPLLVSTARRDDHNNPVWELAFPCTVSRLDNSLALQQVWGELQNDEKHADICAAIGGFVVIVSVKDKRGKRKNESPRRYAFQMRSFLEHIINHDDELRKAPMLENRKRK